MSDTDDEKHLGLASADANIWDTTPLEDMVAVCAREHADPISSWLFEKALGWYNDKGGYRFAKVEFYFLVVDRDSSYDLEEGSPRHGLR